MTEYEWHTSPLAKSDWDNFILRSGNGTWLHSRAFLDEQPKSSTDVFLTCTNGNGDITALLSGRYVDDSFLSHPKSTYGGLVLKAGLGIAATSEIVGTLVARRRELIGAPLRMRITPTFLRPEPDESDTFALLRSGARVIRQTASSLVPSKGARLNTNRRRQIRRGQKAGFTVIDDPAPQAVHSLISMNLAHHERSPVHSLDELTWLMSLKGRVSCVASVTRDGEVAAVLLLFHFDRVIHTQYIASHDEYRRLGALDVLVHDVLERYNDAFAVNFGISTSHDGTQLNQGLFRFKESWGAQTRLLFDLHVR